jgi:hypothetical protein
MTERESRALWRRFSRKRQSRVVRFRVADPDEFNKSYNLELCIYTGSRHEAGVLGSAHVYDYTYEGVTPWNRPFRIELTNDGFDFRDHIYLTPPADPRDWARSFS